MTKTAWCSWVLPIFFLICVALSAFPMDTRGFCALVQSVPGCMQRCSSWHRQPGSRGALGRGQLLVGCGAPGFLSGQSEPLPWGWTLVSLWKHIMSTKSTAAGKKDASRQIYYIPSEVCAWLLTMLCACCSHRASTTTSPSRLSWIIFLTCVSPRDTSATRDSSCRMCVRGVSCSDVISLIKLLIWREELLAGLGVGFFSAPLFPSSPGS